MSAALISPDSCMNQFFKSLQHSLTIAIAIISMTLAGCSGIYRYKNNYEKNLLVSTVTESGSFLTSVDARVDIYTIDKSCKIGYQGSLDLGKGQTGIGLPQNRPAFLQFIFSSSGLLASRRGSTSYDIYFTPRSGHEYFANARYVDEIYAVSLQQKNLTSGEIQAMALDVYSLDDACEVLFLDF